MWVACGLQSPEHGHPSKSSFLVRKTIVFEIYSFLPSHGFSAKNSKKRCWAPCTEKTPKIDPPESHFSTQNRRKSSPERPKIRKITQKSSFLPVQNFDQILDGKKTKKKALDGVEGTNNPYTESSRRYVRDQGRVREGRPSLVWTGMDMA